ncbi:hypothetical protein BJX70DRAFT_401463 [Aspergillus crustosus]
MAYFAAAGAGAALIMATGAQDSLCRITDKLAADSLVFVIISINHIKPSDGMVNVALANIDVAEGCSAVGNTGGVVVCLTDSTLLIRVSKGTGDQEPDGKRLAAEVYGISIIY